jgi:hypothetical protein
MDSQLLGSLIDDILDGNATAAKERFDDAISVKVSDSLDQRKQDIANSLYNNKEQPEEDYEEEQEYEEEEQQ